MRIGNQKTTIYNKVRALAQICVLDPSIRAFLDDTAWKVSVFGVILVRIFLYSGWIRGISPYSVRMKENADQNNSEYGHFLRSVNHTQ